MIDVLSLMLDVSTDRPKTTSLIGKALGLKTVPKSLDEVLASSVQSKEMSLLKQVVERYQRGNLPYINEDSAVEFPSTSLTGQKSGTGLSRREEESVE
jgi:hypothetical protein